MLKSLDCLFPAAKKLLYHAEEDIGVWTFHDMDPLDTWVNDRLLVIGDAAHPFLPRGSFSSFLSSFSTEFLHLETEQ